MRANLYIITSMSIMFSVYAIMMSTIARTKGNIKVHEEFKIWYNPNNESYFKMLFIINDVIIAEDVSFPIIIICGIVLFTIILYYLKKNDSIWEVHMLFLLLPITTVAIHGNHTLIGFIQPPYHATGVGTLYGIVIVTCIAILKIIYHLLYRCINFKFNMWEYYVFLSLSRRWV